MIHLINNPNPLIPWRIEDDEDLALRRGVGSDMGTFHAVLELVPLRDIRVRFNGIDVKSVHMPLHGKDLEIDQGTVVVPKVELHEVLLVSEDG